VLIDIAGSILKAVVEGHPVAGQPAYVRDAEVIDIAGG